MNCQAEAKVLEKNAALTAGTSYSTHPAPSSPSSAWATSGPCLIFSCGNSSQMSMHRHTSCTLLFKHQLWTNLTALQGVEETVHFPSNLLDPLYHFHNWETVDYTCGCTASTLICSLAEQYPYTGLVPPGEENSALHFCIICNQGKAKACTWGRSQCAFSFKTLLQAF